MHEKALITGSSRGIGKAIGQVLAEHNWNVCFTGRNRNDLDILEKSYLGKDHLFEIANFTRSDEIRVLFEKIYREWGGIDALIINVGSGSGSKTLNSDFKNNKDIFTQNFYSAFLSANILSNLLNGSKKPSLTFVGSIASNVNVNSPINYAIAKKAIECLSVHLALKLSKKSVRVNVLNPGHTLTENGFWEKYKQNSPAEFEDLIYSKTLVKELVLPTDIANFIFEIVNSKFSQKLSGSVINFDSGTSRIK